MLRSAAADGGAAGGGASGGAADGAGAAGGKGEDGAGGDVGKPAGGMTAEEMAAELDKLRKVLKDVNAENARRRKESEKFDGVDPEEFKRLREEQTKREEEAALAKGEFEKLRLQLTERATAAERKAAEIKSQWDQAEIHRELLAAANALGAIPQATQKLGGMSLSQIEAFYGSQFEIVDGRVAHKSKLNDQGQKMSAAEFLAAEKAGAGANLFASFLKQGSGAEGGGSAGGSEVIIKRSDPNKVAKLEQAAKDGKTVRFVE